MFYRVFILGLCISKGSQYCLSCGDFLIYLWRFSWTIYLKVIMEDANHISCRIKVRGKYASSKTNPSMVCDGKCKTIYVDHQSGESEPTCMIFSKGHSSEQCIVFSFFGKKYSSKNIQKQHNHANIVNTGRKLHSTKSFEHCTRIKSIWKSMS